MIALATAISAVPAVAQSPYELTVKAGHVIGASRGTLVFDQDSVEYRTTDRNDARKWRYDDIKQLQVLGPRHVQVLTFEEHGRRKLWKDRTFDFEVVAGTVSPELVAFLLTRIERSLVTAVMPTDSGAEPLARIPVKHERRRGSEGVLLVYADHLAYQTEGPEASRDWRYRDIASVFKLDPYRLVVSAYEGGAGETRPFVFDLKRELPDDVYAALWARVNPPVRPLSATDTRAAGSTSR
jgi:hypothetical protein